MSKIIDYYFVPNSPWSYLGHARFAALSAASQAKVNVRPVDLGGIFAVSGGLPLPKRSPQRQAYRLAELARFRDFLGLPLNLQPRFFPVAADSASRLIITVDTQDGAAAAMSLSGALMAAVWAQERDIADTATLAQVLSECNLPPERLSQANAPAVQEKYEANTQAAKDAGMFGAPSYCIDGELFWGQDRLDFVERKLKRV